MPITAKFHSPPKLKAYQRPMYYERPKPDPDAELAKAKANELLNLRSANIGSMLAQKEAAGGPHSHEKINVPAANPRMDELHKELGIDKVVLVKCPFQIDTTPGGQNSLQSQEMGSGGQGKLRDAWMPGFRDVGHAEGAPPRTAAVEYSANGHTAPAYVGGVLLRGGWSVK
jgi:hypothetical protein